MIQDSNEYQICTYNPGETGTPGTWYIASRFQDFIHPFELDPGEKYRIRIITGDPLRNGSR